MEPTAAGPCVFKSESPRPVLLASRRRQLIWNVIQEPTFYEA
jgi:hypothetical protein